MERNCCAPVRCIAKLFMRVTLSDFGEAKPDKNGDDFVRFKDGNIAHDSNDSDVLNPNKLGLQ